MLGYKKTDDGGVPAGDGTTDIQYSANDPEKTTNMNEGALYGMKPAKAGKFHDYFTSCLPSPLKNNPVEISLTGNAPLKLGNSDGTTIPKLETSRGPEMVLSADGTTNKPGSLAYTGSPNNKKMQFTGVTDGEIGAGVLLMLTDQRNNIKQRFTDLRLHQI